MSNQIESLFTTALGLQSPWQVPLRTVYSDAAGSNSAEFAEGALKKWMSWARRSRLEPFKRLASPGASQHRDKAAKSLSARASTPSGIQLAKPALT